MDANWESSKKILVIEDDQFLRELYVDILRAEGFLVDYAIDGEEGYQKMFTGGYDLVLLDIMLPKMDGLKILETLKKERNPISPNHSIVILSNMDQDSAIAQAISMGAAGYMVKSEQTPEQVVNKVKEYIKSS